MPIPADVRPENTPWPTWPLIMRTSSAHEEGGDRVFSVNTEKFVGDAAGNVQALSLHEVTMVDGRFEKVPGSERELPAQLVFLAMGFTGVDKSSDLLDELGTVVGPRGTVARDAAWKSTVDGVFVAGDAGRGQSLIVWAIAEGRACAAAVDAYLTGHTQLPAPINPTTMALIAR